MLAIPFGFSKGLLDCVIGFGGKEGEWVPHFTSVYSGKKADHSSNFKMKIERIIDRCPLDSFGGQGLDKTEDVLYNESITM